MLWALFFLSRSLNAYAGLATNHKERLEYLPILWYTSYPLVIAAYIFMDEEWSVHLLSISCVIQVLATVIAESTILGFIKHVPQDLTGMYGVGKALAQLFEPIVYIAFYFYNLKCIKFFFLLFLMQGKMLLHF